MDPSIVVWVGILIALLQVSVTKILNYYFPDGYHRPGLEKDAPKDAAKDSQEEPAGEN